MKIAIVGGAPSSEMLAPFDDKEWEIWVLGNRLNHYKDKRITRIFEIHDNLIEHGDISVYKNFLMKQANGCEVIVGEKFAQLLPPNFKVYPYKAAEELYGSLYLTSSPANMLAYAVLQGATEVGIYGVDLSVNDNEYFWQRPCMEAWIGFAKGRGIKIIIPEVSHIGKCSYVEGRDWDNEEVSAVFSEESFLLMASKHNKCMSDRQAEQQELALQAARHDGAQQVYNNLARTARAVAAKVDIKTLAHVTQLYNGE